MNVRGIPGARLSRGDSRCGLSGILSAARLALAVGLALALGASAAPVAAQEGHEREARELMELSGLDAELAQIPEAARAQVEQRSEQLPPEVASWLGDAMRDSFAAGRLRRSVKAHLLEKYDPAVVGESLDFLRTPLGRRMTKLETAAAGADLDRTLTAYAASFQDDPPRPERVKLVMRIVRAKNVVPTGIESVAILTEPVVYAINAATPPSEQPSHEDVAELLRQLRRELREPLARAILVRALYAYRDASDAELERYAAFLESAAGQGLHDRMNVGMLLALREASAELAGRFGEIFQQ